jgi:hypothetical protein
MGPGKLLLFIVKFASSSTLPKGGANLSGSRIAWFGPIDQLSVSRARGYVSTQFSGSRLAWFSQIGQIMWYKSVWVVFDTQFRVGGYI